MSHLKSGDICGLGTLGKFNGHMAACCGGDGKIFLNMNVINDGVDSEARVAAKPIDSKEPSLRTDMDFKLNKAICSTASTEKMDAAGWAVRFGLGLADRNISRRAVCHFLLQSQPQ
jgi:hypothetical protein